MEEKRDINLLAVAKFAIALTVLAIVVHILMWAQLEYYIGRDARLDPPKTPVSDVLPPTQPPEPRLRPSPPTDVREMREEEARILHSYGWVDREKGIVRIPIDRAIEATAQKGLPSR